MANDMEFKVEDARLIFRNFSGQGSQYNREGDRNFAVVLDHETAEQMLADGWNVKYREPRDDGDEPLAFVSVAVNFKGRHPRVVLLTSGNRTQLDEKTVGVVDQVDIETADLICRGYQWEMNGKSGVKAYLQTLFVTIREDDLERKYNINAHPPSSSED